MYIDISRYQIKVFHNAGLHGSVYMDPDNGTIDGRKPIFGDEAQSAIMARIEDKTLIGEIVPDIARSLEAYIGQTFGGKNRRTKQRTIYAVNYHGVLFAEKGKGYVIPPRHFYEWARKGNVFIIKNDERIQSNREKYRMQLVARQDAEIKRRKEKEHRANPAGTPQLF